MYILILHNNTPLCIMMHNTPFNGMLKKKIKLKIIYVCILIN